MKTGNDERHKEQDQAGQHGPDSLHQRGKNGPKGTREELADKEFDENNRGQQEQVKNAIKEDRP
jgi:hypothetical protein